MDVTKEQIDEAVAGMTVPKAFAETVKNKGSKIALRWKEGDGYGQLTWAEYGERACRVAAGLRELGVGKGDRVALMLRNVPEFHIADVAALLVGATPFSIYNSSAPEQVEYLASHGEAKVAIVEDEGFLERFLKVRSELPKLERVV